MSKTAKPNAAPADANAETDPAAAKPKSKKKIFIIAGVLSVIILGGVGWYFAKGSTHADEAKIVPPPPAPKFIALEPFTVNLQRETTDQFLQIGISIKILEPELHEKGSPTLEDKVKLNMPEIRGRLLVLLSGKYASDITSVQGKKELAQEIIAEAEKVLGLPPSAANHAKLAANHVIGETKAQSGVDANTVARAQSAVESASPEDAAAPEAVASEEEEVAPEEGDGQDSSDTADAKPAHAAVNTLVAEQKRGITDVLFTSFIVQ